MKKQPRGSWRNKGKQKMTPSEEEEHIRAILKDVPTNEVAKLIQNMEDWGFQIQKT